MNLRTKLLLVFIALSFIPLATLGVVGYFSGAGAIERLVRAGTDERATRMTRRIERSLAAQDLRLHELAKSDSLREFLLRQKQSALSGDATMTSGGAARAVSTDVPDAVSAYFDNNRDFIEAVACVNSSGQPLFRMSGKTGASGGEANVQTKDFMRDEVRYDTRVWALKNAESLRSPITEEPYGAALRLTVPIIDSNAVPAARTVAALVAEVRLSDIVRDADETDAAGTAAGGSATKQPARENVVALDNATDTIIYHTNGALGHRSASDVLPYFKDVAARMKSDAGGFAFYDTPDGDRWLATFRRIDRLNLSLAASQDFTAESASVRRPIFFAIALALVACVAALLLLFRIARQEAYGIERVVRGASAIAAGNLDQRIDISTSGETRDLAESFNAMSDRLRELIAREAESRQFQSFLRISAMVSHDLKNAIAGLSMLVTNMGNQFHREEFRADAIESLQDATEKLKRTVARLSEPAKSLSGEYRLNARVSDLIPVIRRVLNSNAEPLRPLYDIEVNLPDKLVAAVEPERIENVVENLVINALEAMGAKGGKLTVEADTLDADHVFISVADTGTGMSNQFIKTRLFRPFSTTKNKGVGLGLFTCREIVESHGGRIEVESEIDVGTLFRVVLPSRLFKSDGRRTQPQKATADGDEKQEPDASE